MTRALSLLALVLMCAGAAWWVLGDGGGGRGRRSIPGPEAQPAVRAAAAVGEPRTVVHDPRDAAGPGAIPSATPDAARPTSPPDAEPTCEVIVRVSGPPREASDAWVILLTTDPDPEPAEEAWRVEHHPNPSGDTDRFGVARVSVPVGHRLHGVVVRNASGWVWSSTMLPSEIELDGAGTCGVEIEHAIPAGGGSLQGRVLTLDDAVHHDARVTALLTTRLAAHEAWDPRYVTGYPAGAEVDEFGRFQLSRIAGEIELHATARDFVPLWSWHGVLEPGAKLRDLDLVLAPSMRLPVSIPALLDQPKGSVLVTARLPAAERTALLERYGHGDLPAPPPGVDRNERVSAVHLDAHGRVSLAVPQHPVWVSAIRGGAPLPLRHDGATVFEVLHDPAHGPLTLIVEE